MSKLIICENHTISYNRIVFYGIAKLLYGITGIALDGINGAAVAGFHDSHMVGAAVVVIVKKDNVPR